MIDFDFVSPTKIYFGKGKENNIGEILSSYGYKNVFVVYGSSRIEKDGLLFRVTESLNQHGIYHSSYSGIRPNPTLNDVIFAREKARENHAELILAIGGGSVIDTAKSIAVSYFYDENPFDFNLKKAKPGKTLPIGVILTISSAGSELSDSCVIQDENTRIKSGFNSDVNRPLFVIENPELTYSTPAYQTAAAGSDIIMHSLERYFGASGQNQLCDEFALDVVKNVMINTKIALENPNDYEARANLMLASSLSHNGITGIGKKSPFVVHPLEHALSGYNYHITHGAGIALIYPAWAKHVYKKDVGKFAHLAERIFNVNDENNDRKAIIGIEKMKEFFVSIGMPSTLEEVGLTKSDIPALVDLATGSGTRVVGLYPQPLEKQDVLEIYTSLLEEEVF